MPYSRNYDHINDSLAPFTPGEICKTTFIVEKIRYLLEVENLAKLHIGAIRLLDNKMYYLINALNSTNDIIRTIVGDYPCPDDCVPPENFTKEFIVSSGENL